MNDNDKYIGRVLDGRYEILEVIGEGGMAVVYKAMDHRLNRQVAVKIMRQEMAVDEELCQRFRAESHAVAMLSSPNIVAVYDVSRSDDLEYIVMELVDGITLQQYMDAAARCLAGDPALLQADRSRAQPRARARHHPPRHQAPEHHAPARRDHQGRRFRHRRAGKRNP